MTAADSTEIKMNLTSIKLSDPYAKEVVDVSSHVAFYSFNSDDTQWEKTDIEGALFLYNRMAAPYYSIFINNRMNKHVLIEPITKDLDLQVSLPFLLYRNNRGRICGLWFFEEEECKRVCRVLQNYVDLNDDECQLSLTAGSLQTTAQNTSLTNLKSNDHQSATDMVKLNQYIQENSNNKLNSSNNNNVDLSNNSKVNIFSLLSKAQENYNLSQLNKKTNELVGNTLPTTIKHEHNTSHINNKQSKNISDKSNNTSTVGATNSASIIFDKAPNMLNNINVNSNNNNNNNINTTQTDMTSVSVLKFFAAAKNPPSTTTVAVTQEVPFFKRLLSQPMNPVHVDQIEKQQKRSVTPQDLHSTTHILSPLQQSKSIIKPKPLNSVQNEPEHQRSVSTAIIKNDIGFVRINSPNQQQAQLTNPDKKDNSPLTTFFQNSSNFSSFGSSTGCATLASNVNVIDIESKHHRLQQQVQTQQGQPHVQPLKPLLKKVIEQTTPNKPTLMPPTMFTFSDRTKTTLAASLSGTKSNLSKSLGSNSIGATSQDLLSVHQFDEGNNEQNKELQKQLNIQQHEEQIQTTSFIDLKTLQLPRPEPLTQNQFLQSITYLIKNDPDFIKKLHEAYVQSFTEMVSQ